MEVTFGDIISAITMLLGGGGIGWFLTYKYAVQKEAAGAAKEMQDMYQEMVEDVKRDRDEQKTYIVELKEDRKHLRQERDELRNRLDQVEERIRDLQTAVARNGRMVEAMRPFLCGRRGCKDRMIVTFEGDEMEVKTRTRTRRKKDES